MQGDQAKAEKVLGAVEGPKQTEQQGDEKQYEHDGKGNPPPVETDSALVNLEDDAAFPQQNPGDGISADAVQPQQPAVVDTAVCKSEKAGDKLQYDECQEDNVSPGMSHNDFIVTAGYYDKIKIV